MGRKGDAKSAYKQASQYSTVYYGQLAREKIGLGKVPEEIDSGKASAAAEAKADKDEVVRAFKIMAKAGSQNDLYMFLWSFAHRFDTTDEMNAVASIVWDAGGATMAVQPRQGRRGPATSTSIPGAIRSARCPTGSRSGKPVEKPLVYRAGAAGERVQPQRRQQGRRAGPDADHARHGQAHRQEARHQVQPEGKLMDPEYNVKLGAAHLGDLIDDHGGSYVLTLVSYNAGPRRSREWVAEYGDLRTGEVDPIDWVESIPFQETRQYVQKVLQNLHVYRSRLAPKTVRPMTADLARGARTR